MGSKSWLTLTGFGCRQVSDYLTNQVDLVPALKLGHYGFYD